MYFLRRTEALPERLEGVQGLRLSLNSPVVSTDELPVGPSRAGILVHDEADGRPNVTIAVRSLKSGEVAYWSYDGDLREHSSIAVGVDGALSFGEGMGFLFDDEVGGDAAGRREALALWRELVVDEPAGLEADPAEASEGEVLELVDALEVEAAALEPAPVEASPAADPAPGLPPLHDTRNAEARSRSSGPETLSKFRWSVPDPDPRPATASPEPVAAGRAPEVAGAAEPAEAAEPPAGRRRRKAPLARLKLVKRKRGVPAETRAWIQKLLTSF